MRALLRGCLTCSPGAPDALHGALHGLVSGHRQLEDDGRGARSGSAGAAQAPARARAPGRFFHRRCCLCMATRCSASTAHTCTRWEGLRAMLQPCTASAQAMSGPSTRDRALQALMLCMLDRKALLTGSPAPNEL